MVKRVAKTVRTTMYSYRDNGDVIVHQLPFDKDDIVGMHKLKKYLDRGFTFEDPRISQQEIEPEIKAPTLPKKKRKIKKRKSND